MESVRFFVANLPADATEKELRKLFQDYGSVTAVDLKTKKNLVDEDDVKIIAFVTLEISSNDVQYCVKDLNWKKIRGAKINVSQAKESFLERLKREREQTEVQKSGITAPSDDAPSLLLSHNTENKRRTFAEDEELDEDEIAPSLLITKKRAANSMRNGRIVIESFDVAPIHVIESKKSKKHLDDKSLSADQKRKESLNKMKNEYQQKKSAIQAALAGNLGKPNAVKIRFSDDEDNDGVTKTKKVKMFDSDEEGDEHEAGLNLKPEHFSKKGEKLAHMQSKQSLDPRFKIDAKFVDYDEDEEICNDNNVNGEDERDWQMGILQQVVGTQIDTSNVVQKVAKTKKMLHFDPSKEEHKKFIRNKTEESVSADNKSGKKKRTKESIDAQQEEDTNVEDDIVHSKRTTTDVSKEVFYVVTDTLAQSLNTANKGFSLLSMFGKGEQLEERNDQLQKLSSEKILVNKFEPNKLNAFGHDSCSDSEEETVKDKPQQGKKVKKVVVETFFIPKNDVRLKEGAKFFYYDKQKIDENYEEVRNRLKTIIKTKISKTKRNLAASGIRSKKKKRVT